MSSGFDLKQFDEYTLVKRNLDKYKSIHLNRRDYIAKKITSFKNEKNEKNEKNQELDNLKIDFDNKDKDKDILIQQTNKLFWCLYIFLNDVDQYIHLNNHFKIEQSTKIAAIESIRLERDRLKIYKMKPDEIENDLLNEKSINIKTLDCLALLHNMNIIYIKNKTYYLMNYNVDEDIRKCKNIVQERNRDIKIVRDFSKISLDSILDSYYKIDNISKAINSISAYRLADIIEICKRLEIDITKTGENKQVKNKLKQELYTEIIQYF